MTRSIHRTATPAALALPCFLALCLGLAPGCGGSGKQAADEPTGDSEAADETPRSGGGDDLIPPEKFDQIERFFKRKHQHVTHCFVDAIDAGEVPKRAAGRATLTMTIDRAGRPKNVRVTQIQPKSAIFEKCLIENVETWTITTLPKPLDYSYTYGFDTL